MVQTVTTWRRRFSRPLPVRSGRRSRSTAGSRVFCPRKAPWRVESRRSGAPDRPQVHPTEIQNGLTSTKGVQIIERSYCSRIISYAVLISCLLLSFLGCHHRPDAGMSAPGGTVVFDRIVVVPFEQILPEDLFSGTVRCSLCGAIFG